MKPRAWLLAVAAALLLLPRLGATDLWAPDEPRYGQVAEELRSLQHGAAGALLLHLNGAPYTQKPPLYFWLAAALGAPTGRVSETAARLPSALAGIAVVWLVARWGAAMLGRRAGCLGAALLLTSFEFAWVARRAQLDVLLTLFEVTALAAWWRARTTARPRDLALMHGALGLGVLTKGPVGVLVPLLVIVAHQASERRLRELRAVLPPWALALSLGPGLAWIAAATWLAPSGFFAEAVGENLFGRFFAGTSHARPFWYYALALPLDALPWTLLWPALVWGARRGAFSDLGDPHTPARRFLAAWVLVTLIFFSLSSGKRGLYLLPCFPALALLCADALLRYRREHASWPAAARALAALVLAAAAAAGPAARTIARGYGIEVPIWLVAAPGAVAALVVVTVWRTRHAPGPSRTGFAIGVVVAAVWALELLAFTAFLPRADPEKSPRAIARAAAARTPPGQPIGLAGRRSLVGGLAYYGKRPVVFLESVDAVERFLAGAGSAVVMPQKDLGPLATSRAVAVADRAWHGRRSLVVLTPVSAGAP